MDIDTSSLTIEEKIYLMNDLRLDIAAARPIVKVWETEDHPFTPGRLYEGLVITYEDQPYTVIRITRGHEVWRVHLAEPSEEEKQMYARKKEHDICPTCGYSEDAQLEKIRELHQDLAVKIHVLLHDEIDSEYSRILTEEIQKIDSQLWPLSEDGATSDSADIQMRYISGQK
jgi:uncharacterized protein (DUF2249 family)